MDHMENENILIIFLILFLIIIIFAGGCGGYYYYSFNGKQEFKDIVNFAANHIGTNKQHKSLYNSLYTNKYNYTSPPGDVNAMKYSNMGQGTKGEFLPLQGIGAQTFMKNSTPDNYAMPTVTKGNIGGYPNYTEKDESVRWIGFNNFPYENPHQTDDLSNSYTITGANQRVCNPGQKCDNLPCQPWWPNVKKSNADGYCTQGSDALVTCTVDHKNVNNCPEGERFVTYKNEPQWKKVVNST